MSYIALQNTCTAARSTLGKEMQQISSKPQQYTPSKAFKKAFKLLRRFFKSTTITHSTTGKAIANTIKEDITADHSQIVTLEEMKPTNSSTAQESISAINNSSTLSIEEFENELNELAEMAAKEKQTA